MNHAARKHSGANCRFVRLGFLLLVMGCASAKADVTKEYQIKAAFLYNFTKFIEWPAERFTGESDPIVIGVLGENPFDGELESIVQHRTVNGRRIAVRQLTSAIEARQAHLVFVSAAEEKRFTGLAAVLPSSGTVVVSEHTANDDGRGVIVFTLKGNQVRFEIDQDAAERTGVKISAQLLKLATVVRKKG